MNFYKTSFFNRYIVFLILFLHLSAVNLIAASVLNQSALDTIPSKGYSGYRLNITKVQLIKNTDTKAKFRFTIINTGKESLTLGSDSVSRLSVQIFFDTAFYKMADYVLENDLKRALLRKKVYISAGQMIQSMDLKVALSRPIQTSEKHPNQSISNSRINPPKQVREKAISEDSTTAVLDINACPDLQIDKARVIETGKKWILVEFTISNRGTAAAVIAGNAKGDDDNVAIKAYFSGTDKLTKGAVAAGGTFAKDRSKTSTNILLPGETYSAAFQMDSTIKSKYTRNIILYVDNYQLIRECDETNNTFSFLY